MATSYTVSNVNIGAYPNDGQGDPLRTAFTKINKNFANVYQMALAGGGGNVDFSGNIIVGGNIIANVAVIANSITSKGNVTANYFIGDGSKLTGITNGSGLPTQYGQSGKFLTTNGSIPSWATVPSGSGTMSATDIVNTLKGSTVDLSSLVSALSTVQPVDLSALSNALLNLNTVNLSPLANALATVSPVNLNALANALANIAPVNLNALNNAMLRVSTVNLGPLANALSNLATVNLNALSTALATVNLSAISNFTNAAAVVTTVTTNPATGFNGQQIFNTTDSKLYVFNSSTGLWANVAATYTPTAADMAKVEIVDVVSLGSLTGTLFEGRTVYNKNNSNLYIYVNGGWSSYNSFIKGSGTPSISAGSLNDPAYFAAGVITADKIATGAIIAGKITAGAIRSSDIAAGNITADLLAVDSVVAGKIKAGTITGDKIGAGNIWGNTIMAGTITGDLIKVNSLFGNSIMAYTITGDKIMANSVSGSVITAGSLFANALQAYSITANLLAANAVTAASVAAGSIYGNSIMAGTITGNEIKANSVGGWVITANTLFANALQAYSITANLLAANAVTAMSVAAGSIYGNSIMAYTLTGDQIKANSVGGWVITSNTLYANAIQAFSITANLLAANAVTAMSVAANAIYGNSIMAFTITGNRLMANTITANCIGANAITADKIDSRGLTIRASDGTVLFGSGVLSSAVKFNNGTSDILLTSALSATPITYIGSYSTAPGTATNQNVYKNTTDGNTYIWSTVTIPAGRWEVFVEKGSNGTSGSNGTRGNYSIAAVASAAAWSDTNANDAILLIDATGKKLRDQVTLYYPSTNPTFSQTRFWDGSAWQSISAYINGSLLVDGTVSAKKVVADSLSAFSANIGVITTGKIAGDVVFSGNIYGANGIFSGTLSAAAINAVDTINIKNNAVSGAVVATKLPTSTPVVLAGHGARGSYGQSTYNMYSVDIVTTGWTYIPNQTAITGILSLSTDVLDQFQCRDSYYSWLSDPNQHYFDPNRTELQYFRIRAAFGGSNYSTDPQTYWAGGIPGVPAQAWSANEITIIDQTFQSSSTEYFDIGNVQGRGDPTLGAQPCFSYKRDKLVVAQTSLGGNAINTPGGPGWYRFVLDMIALPNPGPNGKFTDPLIGVVDYSIPSQVWNYALVLNSRAASTGVAYPLLYHTIYSGSLTMLLNKK